MRIILASRSPERADILKKLGFEFEVLSADIDESPQPDESVSDLVLRLAKEKAAFISRTHSAAVVAADTLIECEQEALGQPADLDEAKTMLKRYQVSPLKVWTASVWYCTDGEVWSDLSYADLEFIHLNQDQWHEFYHRELWKRRAGAFSIFHQPCPLKIVDGDFDVVRGINSTWLQTCFSRERKKLSAS
jgi:septum formation protein